MPDLWDTNPDHVFGAPGEQPGPAPTGHDDPNNEVKLRDHRGRLRLPAYLLIALAIAVAAIVVLTVAVLIAPRQAGRAVALSAAAQPGGASAARGRSVPRQA